MSDGIHVNHRFLLHQLSQVIPHGDSVPVLDLGCGDGALVLAARAQGWAMVGADAFTHGDDRRRRAVRANRQLRRVIHAITEDRLPFEDGAFRAVVCNQLFEHVHDLAPTLTDIARVLQPGGSLIALYPAWEILLEPHWGIPLVHWFRQGSARREPWAHLCCLLGWSFRKGAPEPWLRAIQVCQYLDRHTAYRPWRQIDAMIHQTIGPVTHLEAAYLAYRWQARPRLARIVQWGSATAVTAHLLQRLAHRVTSVAIRAEKSVELFR